LKFRVTIRGADAGEDGAGRDGAFWARSGLMMRTKLKMSATNPDRFMATSFEVFGGLLS
jgi:hypothetical protein